MYFPILRGKQFELIALRELSSRLPNTFFSPIIEPVRRKIQPLEKTISTLNENSHTPRVILNPKLGDFDGETSTFDFLWPKLADEEKKLSFVPVLIVRKNNVDQVESIVKKLVPHVESFDIFIDDGIAKNMLPLMKEAETTIVFGKSHPRAALAIAKRVVSIEDNFKAQQRNLDYDYESYFSDQHTDFQFVSNAVGFGDYTILDRNFSDSGGPAYVIAIHLSYINSKEFDAMYVRHFVSYDDNSPSMPGRKYSDALKKLVDYYDKNKDMFVLTHGLSTFLDLHHNPELAFPGLGVVKKLSMEHHIETLVRFLENKSKD